MNKNRHIKQNKKAILKIAFFKILTIGGPEQNSLFYYIFIVF